MKVHPACIPCFIRQLTELTGIVSKDKIFQLQLMKDALQKFSSLPVNKLKPPQIAKILHNFIKEETGIYDPYLEIKRKSNMLVKSLLKELEEYVERSEDPFETSLKLAIAGNIIDYGRAGDVSGSVVWKSINDSINSKINSGIIRTLYNDIKNANKILYIADNAGEIYFDKLFIQRIPASSIIFAVRGGPIINDATAEDAIEAGINEICKIIDTGDETPGVILKDCSKDFINAFLEADVIISKGQGNYETLSDIKDKKIYFLFKIKCAPVSENTGYKLGETVILCNKDSGY